MDLRSLWLLIIVCAAVSMVVAAMAALNTALPEIAVAVGADANQMTWIIDGYTLALAALLLPAGALGDRYGRRGVLIVGLAIFAVASLLPVWIDGPTQLIGTRLIAGVGAALIMPSTLSLITSNVPENKRPIAISVWAAVAGAGAIAGFFVTGVLLQFFSWESIFITFAASAALTMVLCLTIGSSKDSDPQRFDFAGSLTSIVAIAAIVFGLIEAPHRGWLDPLTLLCLIGGAALAALFCVIELRLPHHLLDVRLFTNRAFGAGSLAVALQFFGSFGVFYLVLQQLQLVFGYSALRSAVALFPMVIGVAVFTMLGNWIAVRFDALKFVLGGGIWIAGLGILLMGTIDYDQYWQLGSLLAVVAVGIGLASAPATTAIMSNTPLDDQGVGSAVNDTSREVGAAIGIALAGSLLAAGYSDRIGPTAELARRQIGAVDPTRGAEAADHISKSLAEATQVAGRLPEPLSSQILHGAQQAFTEPMQLGCIILACVMMVGSVALTWFAPRSVVEQSAT
ncbi:MFS transporter [Gordonia sp. TBRC 11910]|uniref:MFS transporter n=1 Tax=Gordonia asplenii TaxID=2725283 RepID=A0A848KZT8_9ACTN|nr:MFS transporter [Gordonia asplenii]NMO00958.1 MFS transporter [Gordonia asplenii]